uniref:aldose 1-epimerase family protein n=1 Tax=Pararhizobium sp. IMCC3301 TaxID=3067904 RepID=UPI0027420328|nr:aldose 1-epimerase family protein [Pararhizobium sp. IMCC3301]
MVTLSHGGSSLQVRPLGAELTSWNVDGLELLWQADPDFWPRSSPILFPVVGQCVGSAIRIGDQSYPMSRHGFASQMPFATMDCTDNAAHFLLTDTPETWQHFPFAFELKVSYRLEAASVTCAFSVTNTGAEPMPYALGLHPGFNWPDRNTGSDAKIIFEALEPSSVPVITADGFFTDNVRRLELDGNTLALSERNLGSEALCFLNAKSRALTFCQNDRPSITIANDGFPHFAIWTRPEAPFLSIESWTGHGDPAGFAGAFREKPSLRALQPGVSRQDIVRFSCGEVHHG